MTRVILACCLLGALLFGLAGCAAEAPREPAPLIPMKDFFRNPDQTSYQLSPDGEHLAFLQPWQGRFNVHVQKIGSEEVTRVTASTERDIFGYAWLNNQRLGWIQDKGGDENWHAYAVNLDGSDYLDATPFEGVRVEFVDILRDDDQHVLISMNKRDPRLFDVYRLDVDTGELEVIAENPGNVIGWQTDHDGLLRVAITSDGVNQSILYRASETDEFQPILTTNFKDTVTPLYFTFDNKHLYVLSNIDRDKEAIYTFDPETAEHLEMIYENDEVDVGGLMISRKRKLITGVYYFTDMRHFHFFDEDRGQLQAELERRLPGDEVVVASMSKDERKVLVRTYSDRTRGAYYFFDRDTEEFSKLVDVAPWLQAEQLSDMKPVSYTARDGLTIHGYLTLPAGLGAERLPTVINVHGGPWYRDNWGFNPEVQFLANRGYAVLQVNYRGSTGYGKEFWTKSFKQWGRTMQDDVSDGVKWMIDEGIADPDRVGIYGGSYGGYATLAGLAFTPELYACGVDYVGVSNLFTFMEAIPPYWEPFREMMYEMIGNPETEEEMMRAASPLFHVDKMVAPLLVAQGANDPRVKQVESDQMVAALESRGIDVPYIVKENEGHGFANEENRFDFYEAMEVFLGKHLGGSVEGPAPPAEG